MNPQGGLCPWRETPTLARFAQLLVGTPRTVLLTPTLPIAGFVSDAPGGDRNPAAGCLLAAFGAPNRVITGTLIFAGWNPDPRLALSTVQRLRSLTPDQAHAIADTVDAIAAAVGGGDTWRGPEWDQHMRLAHRLVRAVHDLVPAGVPPLINPGLPRR